MSSNYYISVDIAEGNDKSCYQLWKTPSKLRLFFRRAGVDRSTWSMKLIKEWFE